MAALAVAIVMGPLIFGVASPWERIALAVVVHSIDWIMLAR